MTPGPGGRLDGRRLLVLVPEGGGGRLAVRLEEHGARVTIDALTRTDALGPTDRRVLDDWLAGNLEADWVVLSSAEGVRRLVERASGRGVDLASRWSPPCRVAAIGPATAQALRDDGRIPDRVATDARSEGLAAAMIEACPGGLAGQTILVVRALEGRPALTEALTAAGARVVLAPVYRTVMIPGAAERLALRLGSAVPEFDLLVVTSGAPLKLLAASMPIRDRGRVPVAALGPVTAEVARELGFFVAVTGQGGSLDHLTDAIIQHESTR